MRRYGDRMVQTCLYLCSFATANSGGVPDPIGVERWIIREQVNVPNCRMNVHWDIGLQSILRYE